MFHYRVGLGHQMQRLAGMAQLPARLPARLAPQAAGSRQLTLQPIRGGWLAAVVAVLGQPRLQITHPLQQHGNLLALLGVLGFHGDDLFCWLYASMLHVLRRSA